MKKKSKKSIIILGIFTVFNIICSMISIIINVNGLFIDDITSAVYTKKSDMVINFVPDTQNIESISIKLVNTTNKEFIDYEIRIRKFIVNGSINHYPTGHTKTKIVTIKPKEEKIITFDEFYYTCEYNDEESIEVEFKEFERGADYEDIYTRIENGKDFTFGLQLSYNVASIFSCMLSATLLVVEILLIIRYNKSDRLIKAMLKKSKKD